MNGSVIAGWLFGLLFGAGLVTFMQASDHWTTPLCLVVGLVGGLIANAENVRGDDFP